MQDGVHSITPSTPSVKEIIESLVHIHGWCILNDHTMVTYIPPLSYNVMFDDWQGMLNQTNKSRFMLVYLAKISDRSTRNGEHPEPAFEDQSWPVIVEPNQFADSSSLEVAGVVSLSYVKKQTGPFRGVVQRLLVSPFHRRRGIARALMAEMEKRALEMDVWNLMLDTAVGTPAEKVYPRLGYQKLGIVKDYGFSPKDGKTLLDEIFFWKDLRKGILDQTKPEDKRGVKELEAGKE